MIGGMSDSHLNTSSSEANELSASDSEKATELIVLASRFVRAASRHSGRERSTIVLRTLSNLSLAGPMRIGDLASAEHITQPTMTGVLKRLEAEGLVKRKADPFDGRAQLIDITPTGKEALDDFRKKATRRIQPALAQLTLEERQTLWRASGIFEALSKQLDVL